MSRRSGFGMIWRCPVSHGKSRRLRHGLVRSAKFWRGGEGASRGKSGQGGRRMARHV
jgi:hypothetical protein